MKAPVLSLSVFLVILVIASSGCTIAATDFDSCVLAGGQVMESNPKQCRTADGSIFVERVDNNVSNGLTLDQALDIARVSPCIQEGSLQDTFLYNPNTRTWRIDIFSDSQICSPVCIVFEENRTARVDPGCADEIKQNCAAEGESFSVVYKDQYPESCCDDLAEWESGMDTSISIGTECYQTGMVSGNPVGTCIPCGDGECGEFEDPCNCPDDCTDSSNSDYIDVDDFCSQNADVDAGSIAVMCGMSGNSGMPICGLCDWGNA